MSAKTVASLAKELKISEKEMSGYLNGLGVEAKANDPLDDDTVAIIKDLIKEQRSARVQIPQALTVRDFAEKLGRSAGEIQKALVELGILATVNQSIGADVLAT